MAVRIRLRRTGKRNAGSHRIVVADSRSPRDGRFIENLGVYDPRRKHEEIDLERADFWVGQGAQPSETVAAIMKRARAGALMRPAETTAVAEAAETEAPKPEENAPEAEEETVDAAADTGEDTES